LEQDNYNFNFTLKSIGKHLQQKKCTKICDIFYLLHGSTYVELNKICFVIFRFLFELLCIYKFSIDQFYTKKYRQTSPAKKYTKTYDIFCLLYEFTYVELNNIYFVIFRFFYELQRI